MAWPPFIDDDGSGMTGTALDKAYFDQIKAYTDASTNPTPGVVTIANGGTNVFDVVLPTPRAFYYVSVSTGLADITIRSITGGRTGDLVLIEDVGVNNVWLTYWYGAGQPFSLYNRVTSGATPLGSGGSALYVWEGVWRLAQHDQGKAIRVPYNAANYGGSGGGTVTIPSGNVAQHDYFLHGNRLTIDIYIATNISGNVTDLFVSGFPFQWQQPNAIVHSGLSHNGTSWKLHPLVPGNAVGNCVTFMSGGALTSGYVSFHGTVLIG